MGHVELIYDIATVGPMRITMRVADSPLRVTNGGLEAALMHFRLARRIPART